MKHTLITGGTGLIGSALTRQLIAEGEQVTVLTRDPDRHRSRLPGETILISNLSEIPHTQAVDQVVNLAGEQIVGKRWTEDRKRRIRESRIDLTRRLNEFLKSREAPPQVLISGSAIGYYGDTGDAEISETSQPGNDFGATLCVDWERTARETAPAATRVCVIRTGLVLSKDGGMLEQLLLPFKLGLGARLGNGKQWMSWIHIDDEVAAIRHLLDSPDCSGAFNLTAPNPVTNRAFTRTLAKSLGRPTFLFAPGFVIRAALGEAADLLLGGQRVVPAALARSGYRFRYTDLHTALDSLL